MKKTGLLMGVVLVALLATACEMRFYMDLTVEEDGSGAMSFDLTADRELRGMAGDQLGGDQIAQLLNADPSQPCAVDTLVDGDFEGARMTCPFASLEELMEMVAPMGMGDDPGLPQPMSGFQLERDGDVFLLRLDASDINASYNPPPGDLMGDMDDMDMMEMDDMEGMDMFDMSSFLDIRFTATLPGDIISHNADVVEDTTLTWTFPTDESWLMAESRVDSGMSPIAIWSLIAIGAVILVMIILRMMSDRAKRAGQDPAPPEPDPGQPDDATAAPEDGGEALTASDGEDVSALPEPEPEPDRPDDATAESSPGPDETGEPTAEQPASETEEDDKTETGETRD